MRADRDKYIYIYTREYELDKLSNDLSCFRNADEAHSITILERCFNGGTRQKALGKGGSRREEFAFTRFRWKVLKSREMRGERAFVVESCRCISMQPGIFITDREIGRDRCSYPCSTLEEADWISDWNRIPARPRLGSELRVNNNRWKIRGGWRSRRTIERLEVTSQFILGKISNELSSLVYLLRKIGKLC